MKYDGGRVICRCYWFIFLSEVCNQSNARHSRAADETPLLGEMSTTWTEGWAVSGEERPYGVEEMHIIVGATTGRPNKKPPAPTISHQRLKYPLQNCSDKSIITMFRLIYV